MNSEYEVVSFAEAEPFWSKRKDILLARSKALVIALVGSDLAPQWWNSSNLAFEGQTPTEQFDKNPERVYSYLMSAGGGW